MTGGGKKIGFGTSFGGVEDFGLRWRWGGILRWCWLLCGCRVSPLIYLRPR